MQQLIILSVATVSVATAAGGVNLTTWANSAMAGRGTTALAPLSGSWSNIARTATLSAEWIGSLRAPINGKYRFNCTFTTGSYGLAWVDDHLLCSHGMPAYAAKPPALWIGLSASKPVTIRMQVMSNDTSATAASYAGATMRWASRNAQTGASSPLTSIPESALRPVLASPAEQRMVDLQRKQYSESAGWGSWYPHNLLAVTRLPDAAQLTFGLCRVSTGNCDVESIDSANAIRLGAHAADGSFAMFHHRVYPCNVTVKWGSSSSSASSAATAAGARGADLRATVQFVENSCSPTDAADYAIVLLGNFSPIWGKVGVVDVAISAGTLRFDPAGDVASTTAVVSVAAGRALPASVTAHIAALRGRTYLAFPLNATVKTPLVLTTIDGESASAAVAVLTSAEAKERATYSAYGSAALAELKEAVQAGVMWLVVYEPYASGLILTISRGSMGGGDTQCDWDNFFAAMMLGSDRRGMELGFATFAQTLAMRTPDGHVPNCGSATGKARDRTEPIVGAKVMQAMLKRFGWSDAGWMVAWSFERLYLWHDWAWRKRRLAPLNLIAPGSDPFPEGEGTGMGVNAFQGARWETGMDNSPMYDAADGSSDNKSGIVIYNTTLHKMMLYDVGMTANLASDMLALASLGKSWNGNRTTPPPPAFANVSARVKVLQERAAELVTATEDRLWSEEVGAYVNLLPGKVYGKADDFFYPRVTPTSFYPLMTGGPSAARADELATKWLLSRTGFCLANGTSSFPPSPAPKRRDAVLLQSWREHGADQSHCATDSAFCDVALCVASNGDCDAFAKRGYTLLRNESWAWSSSSSSSSSSAAGLPSSSSSSSRVAIYRFALPSPHSNYSVVGRKNDFPDLSPSPTTPLAWLASHIAALEPGAWPLQLWETTTSSSNSSSGSSDDSTAADAHSYRVAGSPHSNTEIEGDRSRSWKLLASLGHANPLDTACYWGLPSVAFSDPAFATPGGFVYWRGHAWAPLAQLVFWGLQHPKYAEIASVRAARESLAAQYASMWMETAWRPHHQVCENYCVDESGGCCGDTFYHWGALAGYMAIVEAGK